MTDPIPPAPEAIPRIAPALWAWFAVTVGARGLLGTAFCLLAWAAVPAVIGWVPTTVQSGSMQPRIMAGDVVVTMPVEADEVCPGQVVLAARHDGAGELLLHRVQERRPDGQLTTKGDANRDTDRQPVSPDSVRGIGVIRVPWVGLPAVWIRQGSALPVIVAGLATASLVAVARIGRRRLDEAVGDGSPRGRSGERGTRGRRTWILPATVGTAAGLIGAVLVASGAGAAYTSSSGGTAGWAADERYDCFARNADEPTLRYDFSENGGGVVRDSGGGAHDASVNGTASRVRGGCVSNPYLHLTGFGHVWTNEPVAAPAAFTLETWFRTTENRGKIVGFGDRQTGLSPNNDRHLYITSAGRLAFGVYDDATRRALTTLSPAGVADGSWHHAAATMSADGMRLYLDGTLAASDPNTAAKSYTGFWRLGYDRLSSIWEETPSTGVFVGDIDSVAVYDRALPAASVRQHADAGR